MKYLLIAIFVFISLALWCCLKTASDCDDVMGYDNVTEEDI